MKIAVEGCAHGELDKIYEALERLQELKNVKVDLLIICGDFQAVRNNDDLQCMAVPPKYQKLNSFYKYYSGAKVAPVLTVFIGGNHEASNYLSELSYGGWVCPNIYYLGNANVVNIGGLRIAGLSGIYKGQDYLKGHFEFPPYTESTKRSVYHVRNIDVFRLKQVKQPVDIFISHDWPRGIYNFGNKEDLLRWKPFFKEEMEQNKLGSRPLEELLNKVKPAYWFAAHLHCKFAAVVPHQANSETSVTKFLALDKCLPRRKFLHIVDIEKECNSSVSVHYDPEWLCILRSTNHLLNTAKSQAYMPGPGCSQRWDFSVTDEELSSVHKIFDDDFVVPENFQHTATPLTSSSLRTSNQSPKLFINPQTTAFCKLLNITDPFAVLIDGSPNKSSNQGEFSFVEDLNVTTASQQSIDPDGGCSSEDEVSVEEPMSGVVISNSINLPDDLGFFIDTKGFSMKHENKSDFIGRRSFQSPGSATAQYDSASVLSDFPEFKERLTDETHGNLDKGMSLGNEAASPPKKIRRRNQAIYMNTDDDS